MVDGPVSKPGMPGLRGTDHIGFTVPDLAQAVDFFVNVIGCEKFYDLGPFKAEDGWMPSSDRSTGSLYSRAACSRVMGRSVSLKVTRQYR